MAAYDYQCEDCWEIFEEEHPMSGPEYAVQCPVCQSGRVHKIFLSTPATRVAWRDPRSSSDASGLVPKYRPPTHRQPRATAGDYGGV